MVSCCTLKSKLSSSFKKLLLNEHKNIFAQRNTGVFILGASCLKIGGELSGANCPGGELSGYQQVCSLRKLVYPVSTCLSPQQFFTADISISILNSMAKNCKIQVTGHWSKLKGHRL